MTHPRAHRYVRPVTPFEPPAQERCALHRPLASPRTSPHDGRSPRPVSVSPLPPSPRPDPTAVRFADAAVRLVLEVVDGRRPVAQLAAVLDPALVTAVAARRSNAASGTAVLLRTRLHTVDTDTAELSGTYTRGERVYAVAGRIVRRTPKPRAPHPWTITTLWLG